MKPFWTLVVTTMLAGNLHAEPTINLVERAAQMPEVAAEHEKFVQEAKKVIDAPIQATADKLVPYRTCLDFQRNVNKVGKAGNIDLAQGICDDLGVKNNESRIIAQRNSADGMLSRLEVTTRITAILTRTISDTEEYLHRLNKTFLKQCGLDERCLEQKQLARHHQIHTASVYRLNLIYLKSLAPQQVFPIEIRDSFIRSTDKAIGRAEELLNDVFVKLRRRADLPW